MGRDGEWGLVGRERELETVERFLAAERGALVLDGEPGIELGAKLRKRRAEAV